MRTTQLEYFAAVAKHLSFTKASEECHVAQPAISQQVQALEKELGFALFNRTTHGVSLTNAGEAYYFEVTGILSSLERTTKKARAIARGKAGTLNVGIANSGQASVLGVLEKFASKNPEIEVSLKRASSRSQCRQLLEGTFDTTLTATLCAADHKEIEFSGKSTARLRIAVSRHHPLAPRESLTTGDLLRFPHIIADHDGDSLVYATYPYLRTNPETPVIRVEDQGIGLATMLLGFGIEALPETVASAMQGDYILCNVVDYEASMETGWAHRADNVNPALEAFIRFISSMT